LQASLRPLKDFEAKYPPLANFLPSVRAKLSLLPKAGAVDETKQLAEALVAKATEQGDPATLNMVSSILRLGAGKESPELSAVAGKAAEAGVRVAGEQDAQALVDLAATYSAAGDQARARETARKALEAAANEPAARRQRIEQQARALAEDRKAEKK